MRGLTLKTLVTTPKDGKIDGRNFLTSKFLKHSQVLERILHTKARMDTQVTPSLVIGHAQYCTPRKKGAVILSGFT
jgi:hypothetical protein